MPTAQIALIVDDDSFFRAGLRSILTSQVGCSEVIEAACFDEAVERLDERHDISVALFDLSMPGMKEYVFNITGYPADQWARQIFAAEAMPAIARWPGLDHTSSAVQPGANGYRYAHNAPPPTAIPSERRTPAIKAQGLRRGLPQPSQFAVGMLVSPLVSRLEREHGKRATRARRYGPAMNRFLAMGTLNIMSEESRER